VFRFVLSGGRLTRAISSNARTNQTSEPDRSHTYPSVRSRAARAASSAPASPPRRAAASTAAASCRMRNPGTSRNSIKRSRLRTDKRRVNWKNTATVRNSEK
jgi:hypothetical protein